MGRTKTIDDEAILRCAREVFRHGGHAASTRDIAQAAGISQAVLFQRFGSKEELFFRAMTPALPDLKVLLGPYPPRSVRTDLDRIGERIADYLRGLMPTMLHAMAHPDAGRDRLVALHHELAFHPLLAGLTERFERLSAEGRVATADPSASALAFLALIHASVVGEGMHAGAMHHGAMSHNALHPGAMHHGAPHGRNRTGLSALVGVLWAGLAPARAPEGKKAGR